LPVTSALSRPLLLPVAPLVPAISILAAPGVHGRAAIAARRDDLVAGRCGRGEGGGHIGHAAKLGKQNRRVKQILQKMQKNKPNCPTDDEKVQM
jgi:hypothetical protein